MWKSSPRKKLLGTLEATSEIVLVVPSVERLMFDVVRVAYVPVMRHLSIPMKNIAPPPPKPFEFRVVIWETKASATTLAKAF